MKNGRYSRSLQNITKSKFVRSVFLQMVSIFLIVIIAIIVIVFFSFTSEINKSIISERQMQLDVIENTISNRMEEVSSIAYNVGTDKAFYLENINDERYSGYELSKTLERYLVGNDFIEHLAYYRLSEPDTLYVSSGELSFKNFWGTYLGLDKETAEEYIKQVQNTKTVQMVPISFGSADKSYFAYVCPLPQFSENPQAFVLMMIPFSQVQPIVEAQLSNCCGEVAVFDSSGDTLYQTSNIGTNEQFDLSADSTEGRSLHGGKQFITLKRVSASNGWTYVSAIRLDDIISNVARRQLIFIILLLVLMVVAVGAMLMSIIKKYKPINTLAMAFNGKNGGNAVIDEESLLSDTFALLKDDSNQKQKFEAAYLEAQAASKAKSAFLSNMSHDIRTPMNAIVGLTEIASSHSNDPEYVKKCLQKARVASTYLLDIINNVLDMSRIEAGKFTLREEVFELPKLVYGIVTILNQSIDEKKQRFLIDAGNIQNETVVGDSVRLAQVFINILSNSVKFTPDGGTICLKMSQTGLSPDGCGEYSFVFSDTGIGMSPEFTKQVFDTFTRDEKAEVAKTEGTGLGMAIVKNFVELMGGEVKCESELGKGTVFTVTLSIKLAETPHGKTKNFSGKSVLVLGKENRSALSQTQFFKDLGADAEYAKTFENMQNKKAFYDFAIINRSDGDDCIETLKQLKSDAAFKSAEIVVVTRDLFSVDKTAAEQNGAAAIMQAPIFKSSAAEILSKEYLKKSAETETKAVDLTDKRILLVEDNIINREIAHAMLEETKAEIEDAANGKEALDAFSQHEPGYFDIILMDVQMPVMDGYAATRAIRALQRADAKTVPVYAMTANTFDEDIIKVEKAGMNGHLGKPYVSADLYRLLDSALNGK